MRRQQGLRKVEEERDQTVYQDVRQALQVIENTVNQQDEFVQYMPDDPEAILRDGRRSRAQRIKFDRNPSIERFEEDEKNRLRNLDNLRAENDARIKRTMMQDDHVAHSRSMSKENRVPIHMRSRSPVTHHKSSKQLRELDELKECTFHPQLTRRKSARSKVKLDVLELSPYDEDREGGRKPEDLIKWGLEKESKISALRIENTAGPDGECRFKPKLDQKSLKMVGMLLKIGFQRLCTAPKQSSRLPLEAKPVDQKDSGT